MRNKMNIKQKLILLFIYAIFLLTARATQVSAQEEDVYRTIIFKKSNVNIEVPVIKESNIIFNSLPVLAKANDLKKWFDHEIDFTLRDRADFLNINFGDFASPYAFGTLELSQQKGSRWDPIYKINILQPAIHIGSVNFNPGRYRIEFSFDDSDFYDSKATIAAYSYVYNINSYDPTKTFIFTSSTAKLFGDSFWQLVKNRNIILVCGNLEPFYVFGDTCSLDNVEVKGQGANPVIRDLDHSLAAIPSWNHRVLLLSPKVFWNESRTKSINYFLSSWLESGSNGFSRDLGGSILDIYRSLLEKVWVWVFLAVTLLIMVSVRILHLDHNLLNRFSVLTFFSFPVNLFLGLVKKYRWLLILVFIISSGSFFVVFFSRDVLVFLLRDKNIESIYLGYKLGLSSSVSAVGIRHLLEVIFINISALTILLAFSDKIISPLAGYGAVSLRFIGKRSQRLNILCILLYVATLVVRIVRISPQLEVILLAVLIVLLLIREIGMILGQDSVTINARRRWFFLSLILILLIPVSDGLRTNYHKITVPLTNSSVLVEINKDSLLQGIKLPFSPKLLPRNASYTELKVVPNGVLLSGEYLIGYPSVGKIYYTKDNSRLDDVTNKKVALYFVERGRLKISQSDLLKSLSNYIVTENFIATTSARLEVKLPHLYKQKTGNYLFYTYLSRGENTFTVDYTDLNLSPKPGLYTLKLMDAKGDIVESVTAPESSNFSVGVSFEKSFSGTINVERDGVYILELSFNGDPASLGILDYSVLNSITFPSDAVYYLDTERVGTASFHAPDRDVDLNNLSTRNPFSFQLVSFGDAADVVLVPNSNFNLTIDSFEGVINLGGVLTDLSRVRDEGARFQVRYQDGSPLLFVFN